ncbi:MAG: choice-of-anchor C family protein [Cyanobacteria bacterium REEB459]|nr:choice-of-anchor C family protein [Cyanobacteria bacterium REEB459]
MGHSIHSLSILTATLTLTSLTLASRPTQASSFTNGSFELGPEPGNFTTLTTGSTAIPGWLVLGNSIDYISSWQASDGTRSLDLSGQGPGRIQQTFDTITGATYQVLFDLAGNPGDSPSTKLLRVAASGGSAQDYSFNTTGKTVTAMGWQTTAYSFTATSPSTTLLFTSLTNSPYGPALDNVRVSTDGVTSVPTPALLPGLIGMGVAAWRRRRAEAQATGE